MVLATYIDVFYYTGIVTASFTLILLSYVTYRVAKSDTDVKPYLIFYCGLFLADNVV